MTTLEQKQQAAVAYIKARGWHPINSPMVEMDADIFIAGAEWAEAQQRWIPGIPEDGAVYLFRLEYYDSSSGERKLVIEIMTGYIDEQGELYYTNEDWSGWEADGVVTGYIPLTSLPKPPAQEGDRK